jgi:hypothetical protein
MLPLAQGFRPESAGDPAGKMFAAIARGNTGIGGIET